MDSCTTVHLVCVIHIDHPYSTSDACEAMFNHAEDLMAFHNTFWGCSKIYPHSERHLVSHKLLPILCNPSLKPLLPMTIDGLV